MPDMGFKMARSKVIQSLETGSYQHEARTCVSVKNLLATGKVSAEDVIELLARCRGQHHKTSPHHADKTITVHVIRPDKPERWYIKFYFLDPEEPETMFISVHPEDES